MTGSARSWAGLALVLLLGLSACGFGRGGPSASERRAPCDSLAAQAIDADDLGDARRLAARASDCYAGLQTGR